jgi:pSer/pThr/pTyr-binding forkhead associated (FHA) protein
LAVAAAASLILPDGTERELRPDFTIGRAEDNDLTIEKPTVSRHHALITEEADRWFLEDRGSFNGTFLNGSRIQPGVKVPLRHGDRVGLGAESVVFSAPDSLVDPEVTTALQTGPPALTRPLSPFQRQVVEVLCSGWLAGGSLDDLPTNEEIAARLGTPGATETVKAALRRAYAKAGLTEGSPYTKRRALCKIARQRGWI